MCKTIHSYNNNQQWTHAVKVTVCVKTTWYRFNASSRQYEKKKCVGLRETYLDFLCLEDLSGESSWLGVRDPAELFPPSRLGSFLRRSMAKRRSIESASCFLPWSCGDTTKSRKVHTFCSSETVYSEGKHKPTSDSCTVGSTPNPLYDCVHNGNSNYDEIHSNFLKAEEDLPLWNLQRDSNDAIHDSNLSLKLFFVQLNWNKGYPRFDIQVIRAVTIVKSSHRDGFKSSHLLHISTEVTRGSCSVCILFILVYIYCK